MRHSRRCLAAAAALLLPAGLASAQDLAAFEKRVQVKTLDNGLTVLVCERPEAPVFSYFTHVNAGSDREVAGITGLAHMFEHMAFKGTDRIGTTDYAAEEALLEKVEAAYLAYDAERRRPVGRDEAKVAELEKAWRAAMAEADRFVVKNELSQIVEREGGVGINAFTSSDETGYFYSLPSNRLELWAHLESERLLKPVMREFYRERDVVTEERRMRVDSSPTGRLFEQMLLSAFSAHPYGQSGIGWPSDLKSFSATDALDFYRRYYVPSNMIVAVVGDVKAAEVFALAERYFGRLPRTEPVPPLRTEEPPQRAETTVVFREAAQPLYAEAYHKPDARHPDDAVYDVIADLMSNGRTSRLYRALVRDKKVAAHAAGFSGYPGDKYPNLFLFYAVPLPGHTLAENREAMQAEIARLGREEISDEELAMVKTRAKANLIRKLANNTGLALQLAFAQARLGDWRELFRQVDRIDKVTKADVKRVAAATFVAGNRTVGMIESVKKADAAPEGDR